MTLSDVLDPAYQISPNANAAIILICLVALATVAALTVRDKIEAKNKAIRDLKKTVDDLKRRAS